MMIVNIYGANRYEKHDKTRVACRGIVINNNKLLLSYEKNLDQYFIPGGGVELNETLEECCVRELKEETGYQVEVIKKYLTINEYYQEYLFVNHYFICKDIAEVERKLTEREKEAGLEPTWVSLDEILLIFSKHQDHALNNEMKRGAYYREYTALLKYLELVKEKNVTCDI